MQARLQLSTRLVALTRNLLLRDALLAGAAAVASRSYLFALNVLVSRMLADKHEFGVFSSVYLMAQLAAMFTGLGLAQTSAQAIAARGIDGDGQNRTIRTLMIMIAVVSAGASGLLLCCSPLACKLLGTAVPLSVIYAGTALLFAQLIVGGLEGILRGLKKFRTLWTASVTASALGGIFAWPLIHTLGVSGGLLAASLFLCVQSGLMIAPLRKRILGPILIGTERAKLLRQILAPAFANGLAWNLAMMVPPLMLVRSAFGFEHIAVWNASTQLRYFLSFAPIVIANSAIPHLAESYARGDRWVRQALGSMALSMVLALVAYVPVVLLARPLMSLYGATYAEHGSLLVLVASFVLLQVLGTACFAVLLSARRTWETAILNCTWCVLVLAVAPLAISRQGAYSLAWLYLYSYIPVLAVLCWLVARAIVATRAAERPEIAGASSVWSVVNP